MKMIFSGCIGGLVLLMFHEVSAFFWCASPLLPIYCLNIILNFSLHILSVGWYRQLCSVLWIYTSCSGKHSCHTSKVLIAHSWSWSPFMQIESLSPGQACLLTPLNDSQHQGEKFYSLRYFVLFDCCVFLYIVRMSFPGCSFLFFPLYTNRN